MDPLRYLHLNTVKELPFSLSETLPFFAFPFELSIFLFFQERVRAISIARLRALQPGIKESRAPALEKKKRASEDLK